MPTGKEHHYTSRPPVEYAETVRDTAVTTQDAPLTDRPTLEPVPTTRPPEYPYTGQEFPAENGGNGSEQFFPPPSGGGGGGGAMPVEEEYYEDERLMEEEPVDEAANGIRISKKNLIIALIVGAVLIAAFFMYKRMKKGKK
jgi:hypothetical protein